jgi:hypothetical protein
MQFPYENCVTCPIPVPVSWVGIGAQRTAALFVAAQILRGKKVCICVWCSLVPYRLGAVLCVWLASYRVHHAPLPYRGKLPVHKGASLCSLPAAVHHGRGPTPWCSLTLTGLHEMSLWLPSIARLCLLLTFPIPLISTLGSAQYMYYLQSRYKMLIPKQTKKVYWAQKLLRLVKNTMDIRHYLPQWLQLSNGPM